MLKKINNLLGVNKQIIYLSYIYWIIIYTFLFLSYSIFIGRVLENLMPKFNKDKNKILIVIEIYLQISLMVVSSYIFREYLNTFLNAYFNIYGNPDKFAILIVASTMFAQQKDLMKKITFI